MEALQGDANPDNFSLQQYKAVDKPGRKFKNNQVFLFPAVPGKELVVSVIVPVKNEAHHLIKTLDALRNQTDVLGNPLPYGVYEVLLLTNNCTDASNKIARKYQQRNPQFQLHVADIIVPQNKAHIGTVRRLLMDEAYRRHQFNNYDGIIASTDGDTEVDSKWIYYTLAEIQKGCDVVGGRILSKPVNEKIRKYYLQDVTYKYLAKKLETQINPSMHDAWPSHYQCFGASLAVLSSVYHKAGRLPAIPFLEDAAFCSAAYRMDARIRCSPDVVVYTSSRAQGRVKIGLSAHLKNFRNMHLRKKQQYVESPALLKIKFTCKQKLAHCHNICQTTVDKNILKEIAGELCIKYDWLYNKLITAPYFGELWEETEAQMRISPGWSKKNILIPVTDAIQQLRSCLNG